jgi:hypothetical protein
MPKRQVAFRFGREHELRYIKELPRVGDHLRVGERLWIVTSVEDDPVGTSVICERLRDVRVPDQELHHGWRRHGLVEGDGDVSP